MILECPSCHARFKVPDGAIPPSGRTVRCSKCANEWHADQTSIVKQAPVSNAKAEAAAAIEAAKAAMAGVPREEIAEAVPVEEIKTAEARVESDDFLSQLEAAISASEASPEPRGARPAKAKAAAAAKPAKPARKPINPKPFKIAVPALAALWLILAFITYFPKWMNAPVLSGIYHTLGIAPTDGLVFQDVTMEKEKIEGGKTKFIIAGSISNHSSETRAVPTVRVNLKDANGKDIWGRSYPVNTELNAGEVYPFRIGNVETAFAKNVTIIKVDMGNPLQLMVR